MSFQCKKMMSRIAKVSYLLSRGYSPKEIADATEFERSQISRDKKRLKQYFSEAEIEWLLKHPSIEEVKFGNRDLDSLTEGENTQ